MDHASGAVRKMEDSDNPDSKRDVKPQVKTLNRVPRMFHSFFIKCLLTLIALIQGACVGVHRYLLCNPTLTFATRSERMPETKDAMRRG